MPTLNESWRYKVRRQKMQRKWWRCLAKNIRAAAHQTIVDTEQDMRWPNRLALCIRDAVVLARMTTEQQIQKVMQRRVRRRGGYDRSLDGLLATLAQTAETDPCPR